jgi:hypothetical protein
LGRLQRVDRDARFAPAMRQGVPIRGVCVEIMRPGAGLLAKLNRLYGIRGDSR